MKTQLGTFYFIPLFLMLLFSSVSAQTIYFCEGVDDNGYPISEASSFTIPDEGGYLYVLVRLPYEIACESVRFEIYRNGEYDNTINLDTEDDWSWFWKQITFYKRGTYEFYVYDCYDYELVTGKVKINYE
ncbi:MAG: hypothetical protein A2W30_02550 [Ignavibacteria bacterium RBG_16_36_9]|nr:MAG: hypothetical protein A2W30_02550 [Ignavibacteria bacterium RBG_16_36_9]